MYHKQIAVLVPGVHNNRFLCMRNGGNVYENMIRNHWLPRLYISKTNMIY